MATIFLIPEPWASAWARLLMPSSHPLDGNTQVQAEHASIWSVATITGRLIGQVCSRGHLHPGALRDGTGHGTGHQAVCSPSVWNRLNFLGEPVKMKKVTTLLKRFEEQCSNA